MSPATFYDIGPAHGVLVTLGVMAGVFLAGVLLTPRSVVPERDLFWLACVMAGGLVFCTGVSAAVIAGRPGFFLIIPVLQIVWAAWHGWKSRKETGGGRAWPAAALVVSAGLAAAVSILFAFWWSVALAPGGEIRQFHSDLGYFGQLALGFGEGGFSSLWSGVLGAAADQGGPPDVWYHWAPVWFASAVHKAAGVPVMTALLQVGEAMFTFPLVLAAGAVAARLTGWGPARSLLAGGVSIVAVPVMKMFGVLWIAGSLPYGVMQFFRESLLMQFSYKVDALLFLVALAAWLRRRDGLAVLLVFFAGTSSPHSLAAAGVMSGALFVIGVLLRDRVMWGTGAVVSASLLSAWAVLAAGFGVNLPKSPDTQVMNFGFEAVRLAIRAGTVDSLIGIALCGLLVAGIVHLLRARDGHGPDARPRLLGWMAVCALAGSYAAFHLFPKMGDRFHFTTFAHVVLVFPAAVWGLARLASRQAGWRRLTAVAVMGICGAMGLADMLGNHRLVPSATWTVAEVRVLGKALGGEPFGYFASDDRNWWISKHSTLASVLDVRCSRLNGIKARDGNGTNTVFYGSSRPGVLVPARTGETDEEWSLRFARKTGIRHVLEISGEALPEAVVQNAALVASTASFRLYRLSGADPGQGRLVAH